MSGTPKPLPDVDDPVTSAFWEGTREGRLLVPRCPACGYVWWPPEPVCPECLRPNPDWQPIAPTGTLWSYAVYRRALDSAFADEIPYAVGLVELAPGIKMYGIVDGDIEQLEIGQPMRAVFDRVNDQVTFVRWRVAAD